jgi:hypothetical protein
VRTVRHANAVEISVVEGGHRDPGGALSHAGGNELTVRGGAFVLAMGGIGNPRLLRASNRERPAGIGVPVGVTASLTFHLLIGRSNRAA